MMFDVLMCGGFLVRPKPKSVEVLFTSPLRGLALGSTGNDGDGR